MLARAITSQPDGGTITRRAAVLPSNTEDVEETGTTSPTTGTASIIAKPHRVRTWNCR